MVVKKEPMLRCAIQYKGKTYYAPRGGDHTEALQTIPIVMRDDAEANGVHVYVTHTGKQLNRGAAARYALDNDLVDPKSAGYIRESLDLTSDLIRPSALANVLLVEAAVSDWWSRLNRDEQQVYVHAHPQTRMKVSALPQSMHGPASRSNRPSG
jgi:hypothetical protein